MYLPKQNIPENEKNEKWLKDCVKSIINNFNEGYYKNIRDFIAYEILDGRIAKSKFEYITKEFGKEYPIKLKNYPLIRPIITTALGEEIETVYNFHVKRTDESGLVEKNNKIIELLYDRLIKDIEDKYLSNKPISLLDERKIKELKEGISNNYVTELEIAVHELVQYFEHKLDLKFLRNKIFASILEVGKVFFCYEKKNIGSDIAVRIIPSYNVVISEEENTEDFSWICERQYMTKEEILDLYGNYLSDEDKKKLESESNYISDYTNHINNLKPNLAGDNVESVFDLLDDINDNESFYSNIQNKIEVYKGEWKSIRKLTMAEIKNEKYNSYFYKIFNDKEVKSKKDVKKDERYIQELYTFVCIGSDMVVLQKTKKAEIQMRSIDNPYYVKSTYKSFNFSIDNSGKPFSLVWYLKDLQELYNILHYHRERMISLSGVKGSIYDLTQLPNGMDLHDVLYYKKLGLIFIESEKSKNGFNQFGNFNDSLDASVSVLTQMLEDIRMEAERISGFNRQRQGQMFQKDLVGQIEKAIKQGFYSTAVLFYFQIKVYKELLEGLVNFSKFIFRENEINTLYYVLSNGVQKVFSIPDNFIISDFGIFFSDSVSDNKKLETLKASIGQLIQNQQLTSLEAIKLLNVESIAKLENDIITKLEQKEKEMRELEKQKSEQPDKELEFKKQELQTKIDIEKMKIEAMKEIKMLEIEIEKQKQKTQADFHKNKFEIEKQKIDNQEKNQEKTIKLKEELLNLEKIEYEDAIKNNDSNLKNRKEIKNII